jgi:lipoprotein-anchoring transpeptidase ErfK/SrfK
LIVLFVLLAAATVPLARAAVNDDTVPATTTPPPTETVAPTTDLGTTTAPATTVPATTVPATTTPVTTITGIIPDGVTIQAVAVGGMTAEQATATVQTAFDLPVQFKYKKRKWWASPERLGAKAYVSGAVSRALTAPPGSIVDLVVTVKGDAVKDYVAFVDRNFERTVKNSTVRLVKLRPKISEPRDGFDIKEPAMTAAIVRALKTGSRGPLPLEGGVVKPTVTLKTFGSIIVIRRGSNRLYLYDGQKFVRRFGVATGQASYPTPLGQYAIATKLRDPWWYPPENSDWAQGKEPIPPGPGNPLGTRWMGLTAPLVGIHGTPDAYSIGYSASHGCIRMLVPEAEWLFDHVEIGTPVFIVSA